jgi:hypothetical protein
VLALNLGPEQDTMPECRHPVAQVDVLYRLSAPVLVEPTAIREDFGPHRTTTGPEGHRISCIALMYESVQ